MHLCPGAMGEGDIWAHGDRAFLWAELCKLSSVWGVPVFSALGEVTPVATFPHGGKISKIRVPECLV